MLNINTFMMMMIIVVQMKHNYFESFKLDISKDCLLILLIIPILAILSPQMYTAEETIYIYIGIIASLFSTLSQQESS